MFSNLNEHVPLDEPPYQAIFSAIGNISMKKTCKISSRQLESFHQTTFFFDKSVECIKKAQRGATLSTLGVYKGARRGREEKEKI
jgi:hypothetical protein